MSEHKYDEDGQCEVCGQHMECHPADVRTVAGQMSEQPRDYCPIPCVRSHEPNDFCFHVGEQPQGWMEFRDAPQECQHEWDVSTGGAHPVGTMICVFCGTHKEGERPQLPARMGLQPGGEWTPETVKKLLQASNHGCPVITDELCKIISKTINAALAAQADQWRKALTAAADLAKQTFAEKEKQLAAEQEKRKPLVNALKEANRYVGICIGEGTPEESQAALDLRQKIDAIIKEAK